MVHVFLKWRDPFGANMIHRNLMKHVRSTWVLGFKDGVKHTASCSDQGPLSSEPWRLVGWTRERTHEKKGWHLNRDFTPYSMQIIKPTQVFSWSVQYNYLWLPFQKLEHCLFQGDWKDEFSLPQVRYMRDIWCIHDVSVPPVLSVRKLVVLILVRSQSLRLKWVSWQHWHRPFGVATNPWEMSDIIRYIKQNWRTIRVSGAKINRIFNSRLFDPHNIFQQQADSPALRCLAWHRLWFWWRLVEQLRKWRRGWRWGWRGWWRGRWRCGVRNGHFTCAHFGPKRGAQV